MLESQLVLTCSRCRVLIDELEICHSGHADLSTCRACVAGETTSGKEPAQQIGVDERKGRGIAWKPAFGPSTISRTRLGDTKTTATQTIPFVITSTAWLWRCRARPRAQPKNTSRSGWRRSEGLEALKAQRRNTYRKGKRSVVAATRRAQITMRIWHGFCEVPSREVVLPGRAS
ncbi:unnamed protein product [Pylaiella littoralis]